MNYLNKGRILLFTSLLLAWCYPANSQLISAGIKGGVLLTDPLSTGQSTGGSVGHDVRRYLVGPTGELHLPFGFSIEHLSPEFRYTRFPTNVFGNNFDLVHSTLNQADFLVGLTFRRVTSHLSQLRLPVGRTLA